MSFVQKAVERLKKVNDGESGARVQANLAKSVLHHNHEMPDDPGAPSGSLVSVDEDALRRAGFIASENFERRLAEEYRYIKRPLIASAFGIGVPKVKNGNLIMLASALSGEGKTHTCINLAMSMAMEKDRTVLLIDGDVAKPTISGVFGLAEHPGLLDFISGDVTDLREVIVRTDLPKLRIMPAGRPRKHATELLASNRTRSVIQELQSRYSDRIVLMDSPPLLATSEALVLASLVGQVLVVVAADSTPRAAVREAVAQLGPEQAVSLVLNKNASRIASGYGYYGYGTYGNAGRENYDAENQ